MSHNERLLGGLWGAVVADALGVPVEFESREALRRDPVVGVRGYGSHNQPPGTWSDDSSLMLCTLEGLLHGFRLPQIGDLFVRWLTESHWTPWGSVFDVGYTTDMAIRRLQGGASPEDAGQRDEWSNGNGSLMRILPVALRFSRSPTDELLGYAHRTSALTHAHPRSQLACGYYCLMTTALLGGSAPNAAYGMANEAARRHYKMGRFSSELPHFERLLSGQIDSLPESSIESSGYVVHTLEASIWCLLNSNSYSDTVLAAVNLGGDTDTTGIVAGGLAGVHCGIGSIPVGWLEQMARRADLSRLFEEFVAALG